MFVCLLDVKKQKNDDWWWHNDKMAWWQQDRRLSTVWYVSWVLVFSMHGATGQLSWCPHWAVIKSVIYNIYIHSATETEAGLLVIQLTRPHTVTPGNYY